ncbi:hypothetical protein D4764_15G0005950 [Takifugu flavidus]|uniref:Ig-like domain-containing protein n=1 Tax=Takifugu flavidus TaxID=433684 RepID=A0A5C6P351_9TELE|nr:hypothetical protein D4764_15G0005950 [Takifugu flavidus]
MLPLLYAALCLMLLSVLTGEAPEFLLYISVGNLITWSEALRSRPKFSSNESRDRVDLQVSSAAVPDSAVYDCALLQEAAASVLTCSNSKITAKVLLQRVQRPSGSAGVLCCSSRFCCVRLCCEAQSDRKPTTCLQQHSTQLLEAFVTPEGHMTQEEVFCPDCSVYRWLFQHTVRRTSCLLCFPETTWGQKISPVPGMKNGISSREGEDVTLRCNYETSSSDVLLYWYKHQSDYEAPQFILWKGARSYTGEENIPDKRYRCNTGQQESELTITDVTLADSAVYYCALEFHGDTKRRRRCTKT